MKRRRATKRLQQSARIAWAMESGALSDLAHQMAHVAVGGAYDTRNRRIGGEAATSGQIGVINIAGPIQKKPDFWMEVFGGTSTDQVSRAFDRLLNDQSVSAIVLNVDSPGGTVSGVPELAAKIFAARGTKPVVAVANGMMASAALWIASAADEIVAAPSTPGVGSIGVLQLHFDESKAMEKAGVTPTFITSAKFKAEGNPYEPLSDEAKAHLQARVDAIHTQFVAAISRHRGVSVDTVESKFGQGRTLLAEQAKAVGLVDRIATLEDVLRELGGSASASSVVAQAPGTAKGEFVMNPKVRLALIEKGLATISTSAADLQAALNLFYEAKGSAVPSDPEAIVKDLSPFASATLLEGTTMTTVTASSDIVSRDSLVALVHTAGNLVPTDQKFTLLAELSKIPNLTLSAAMDRINQCAIEATPVIGSGGIRVTGEERDKIRTAARDAIVARAYNGSNPEQIWDRNTESYVAFKPDPSTRGLGSLPRLASRLLETAGVPRAKVEALAPAQIASIICGGNPSDHGLGMYASDMMYNTSGMFSNILLDAQNVMLRRSYDDSRTTFQVWARQGESIADFRDINKVIGGEVGDPKAIGENGEFEETTFADGKEKYRLVIWGERFSVTWMTIVNDQLGSFSEVPMKLGRAMRRKQNRLVYGTLKDNANLADGGALFNATAITSAGGHNNLTTGALSTGADYTSALNTMEKKLAEQKGLNTTDGAALNLVGKWLLHPPALKNSLGTLMQSVVVPGGTNSTTNIYAGAYQLVQDAELAASSSGGSDTAFYMMCDPMDIDTVEYAYLSGYETPRLESATSFDTLGIKYRIFQPFAAKPLDYRGMQKHAGA